MSTNLNNGIGASSVASLRRGTVTTQGPMSQDTSSQGKRKAGGKPPGPEWNYATNLNKYQEWKCNFCGEQKSGGAPRIRDHLLGGNTRMPGGKCKGLGAEEAAMRLSVQIGKLVSTNKRSRSSSFNHYTSTTETLRTNTEERLFGTTPTNESAQANEGGTQTNVMMRPQHGSPEFQVGSSRSRQVSLETSFKTLALEEAQLALAKAVYFTGGSLSIVTRDAWKDAWKRIGEYGAGFTPPTYHHMRNQLLEKCYANTEHEVQRVILNTIDQSGCTIVSDGWSNVQRQTLINVMLVCPRGECFIKAVDSSGQIKSGSYIADIIGDAIEALGKENVTQVIMDNAKNCRAAGRMLENRFSHIYSAGCSTHSLNLVLQDWYKSYDTDWFKWIVDNARKIVKFVLKRQRILDMYRQRMSTMLKLPCETRFCTNFYTVESLIKNKNAVMETFVCASFSDWEEGQSVKTKSKIGVIRDMLANRLFWDDLVDVHNVMMPIMLALRQLDSRLPNIGKVWMAWWTVQESLANPEEPREPIVKPWKAPFNKARRGILGNYVHARWIGAHSPLHSVAFLLDPEYWAMDLNSLDEEVLEDFYDVLGRFFTNADEHAAAVSDLTKFKLKEGKFGTEFVQKLAAEQPAWKWWMMNGGSVPTLKRLAVRVLAQCASNSSSERNWSTYKYVHSTIRNRLLASRAEKLVYMFCNHRLLRILQDENYTEEMPQWSYDVTNDEDEADIELATANEGHDIQPACTIDEVEENLEIDVALTRRSKRRWLN